MGTERIKLKLHESSIVQINSEIIILGNNGGFGGNQFKRHSLKHAIFIY